MARHKRRRGEQAAGVIDVWIETIDRFLARFCKELAAGELKLADYMRLAELEAIAAENGEKEVIVRWVDCDAETERKTEDDL